MMKFYKKQFMIFKDWWVLFPTITILINRPFYAFNNIDIQFDFLCFHWRIVFKLKEKIIRKGE